VSLAALVADGSPFADALHADWTKLRTLASTGWLLLGVVAFTVAVSAAADAAANCPAGGLDRLAMLAVKAALVVGLVLAAAAVAVLACVLLGRVILPGHGFTPAHGYQALSLGGGPVLRAACGSALYLALIALLSLGLATAVREAAVAIGIVLALLYVFPIVSSVTGNPHWQRHLEQIGPMTAGLNRVVSPATQIKHVTIVTELWVSGWSPSRSLGPIYAPTVDALLSVRYTSCIELFA
jgi:ABC-2 type transport system permease protein